MPAASARVISFFMIKPSSLNEKFPGLRTPSPSPRHLRQAIDLIGLIKRVYYLVALAWAYGWVKAIGQFIESLDSVVKKRRSEEEKGGCPPKKAPETCVEKAIQKTVPCTIYSVPKHLQETPAAPGIAFAPSALPSSGQKKRRPPARRKIVLSNKKGGLAPPLKASLS